MRSDEFTQIMEIVAPSFQGDELRAAFLAADLDGDGTIERDRRRRHALEPLSA